jgi:hypothetical protein
MKTNDLEKALGKRRMWFGTYTKAGELRKVQVWCFANSGNLEFLTSGDSLKVKRARRNPRVICNLGWRDGPSVSGTAEIVTDLAALQRGYRTYWRTHPAMMLLLWWPILRRIRSGRQVLVRITPEEPSLLNGTDRSE